MAETFNDLLESGNLSEDVKTQIQEAWESRLAEAKDQLTAELREEFATRYENDKSQIVEAADKMIGDVIAKELEEFKEDKREEHGRRK